MAAINFPPSPSNGDTHTENGATYEYELSTTAWLKVPSTWINDGAYVYYDGALNVGIGETTPASKLHVVGTTLLAGETDVTGDFAVNTDTFWVNVTNGRVGIGTNSPARTLDVQTLSGDASVRIYARGTTSADDAIIYLGGAGTTATNRVSFGDADDADAGRIIYAHSSDYMSFTTAAVERLRIDSSGNVGIGTTSPSVALEVNGHVAATRVIVGEGSGAVALTTNDGQGNANLTFNHANGIPDSLGNGGRIVVNTDATASPSMAFELGSAVTAGVTYNTSEVMRIDGSGITVTGTVAATDFTGDGSALTGVATSAQGTSADTAFGWGDHGAAGYLPLAGGTMTGQLTSPNINLTGFLNFTGTGTSLIYSNDGGEDIEIRVNNSQSATATDLLLRGRGANDTITTTIENTIVSQISSTGLVVTGTVDATSYTGDGSALTGISASGGGTEWTLKTTTYTAVANDGIIADTSGGIWTLTLPATPATGDYIQIIDGADWNANNLTVARNGQTIESVASDLIMDVGNIAVDLIFDGTTWQVTSQTSGYSGEAVTTTGIQTLSNKTMDDVALTGKVTEGVFVITGTTPELDPANGTMTTWVLSGASTPTFAATWAQGESMLILIDDGSANTITWPSMLWAGGVEPTLATSGYSAITIFKLGANIFGTYAGDFS